MTTQIKSHTTSDNGKYNYLTLTTEKGKDVYIHTDSWGTINVLLKNASHQAYQGMGKFFDSWKEAIENYKSSDIVSALHCARITIEGSPLTVLK
jgi:hypothetical protein